MIKRLQIFLFFLSILLVRSNAFAAHIIGGDINLRASTTIANQYTITMTFFRDCGGGGAAFDSPVYIGCYNKKDDSGVMIIDMGPVTITPIVLGNACYVPSLCMEKGVYTAVVSIPNNPYPGFGYYFSWHRCCRNGAIINIVSPGDEGSIFYSEIADPGLNGGFGFSTPSFSTTTLPDGYMCRGYLNSEQGFSTTPGNAGSTKIYSFSTPLSCNPTGQCSNNTFSQGTGYAVASTAGNYLPGVTGGVYGTITWAPTYSVNPMGDPFMAINATTGVITVTPPTLGIFVICVKIEEWKIISGVNTKISEIRRDFQFDVLNCAILSVSLNPGNPVCVGQQTTITAVGANPAATYLWASGQVSSAITVTPTASGTYTFGVTTTFGMCVTSATTTLTTNALPVATVTSTGNICTGQNVTLTAAGGTIYSWSNGAGGATLSGVAPGTYTCYVTNANNCSSSATGSIYAPMPLTYTWTGAGSTLANNWFDGANWGNTRGCIPSCGTDVIIPNVGSNSPDIGYCIGAGCVVAHFHDPTGTGPKAACRDITINSGGGQLSFSVVNGELDICGDLNQNGVIQNAGQIGKFKFMGSVPQVITRSATGSGNAFHDVEIANTASPLSTVTVKEGVGYNDLRLDVSGILTFTSGIIVTEGGKLVELQNKASGAITGHGPTKYVYGRVKRAVQGATSYDFPVGSAPVSGNAFPYELMNINFSTISTITDLTVSFENPANATGNGLPVAETTPSIIGQYTVLLDNGGTNTGVGYAGALGGVWTMIPNDYSATPVYTMTLYGRNYDNSGSFQHTILKRNTFCNGAWTANGVYNTSSVAGNVVTATRTGMSGFSQAAIAKTIVPLPVELLAFDASCVNNKTKISWITASETNNDYFTIERSCNENLFQFEPIQKIPGGGNSSNVNYYSFVDSTYTNGECYYRLLQTDYNGSTNEYAPVSANCAEEGAFSFIGVIPNPADEYINILFSSQTIDGVKIEIADARGKKLFEKNAQAEIGLNKVDLSLSGLSSGIYFVKLNNGTISLTKKVIKKS